MLRAVSGDIVTRPVEVLSASAVAVSCVSTAVDELLASFTIPAGTLGVNSVLRFEPFWTYTNSANNKILRLKIAGTIIYGVTRTTTTREAPLIILANRNSMSSQIMPINTNYYSTTTGAADTYTIDLSGNVTVEICGQRANAGDTLKLECYNVIHMVGD